MWQNTERAEHERRETDYLLYKALHEWSEAISGLIACKDRMRTANRRLQQAYEDFLRRSARRSPDDRKPVSGQ